MAVPAEIRAQSEIGFSRDQLHRSCSHRRAASHLARFCTKRTAGLGLQDQIFPRRLAGYDFGEPVGAALAAGETAGEACAGVVPGDDCAPAGAGEVCGAGWFFISSRRKALLATLWCA